MEAKTSQGRKPVSWIARGFFGCGAIAIGANIYPPPYLLALVVLSTTCGASTLAVPVLMACYWRRASAPGIIAAMVSGSLTALALYL